MRERIQWSAPLRAAWHVRSYKLLSVPMYAFNDENNGEIKKLKEVLLTTVKFNRTPTVARVPVLIIELLVNLGKLKFLE